MEEDANIGLSDTSGRALGDASVNIAESLYERQEVDVPALLAEKSRLENDKAALLAQNRTLCAKMVAMRRETNECLQKMDNVIVRTVTAEKNLEAEQETCQGLSAQKAALATELETSGARVEYERKLALALDRNLAAEKRKVERLTIEIRDLTTANTELQRANTALQEQISVLSATGPQPVLESPQATSCVPSESQQNPSFRELLDEMAKMKRDLATQQENQSFLIKDLDEQGKTIKEQGKTIKELKAENRELKGRSVFSFYPPRKD